MIYVIQSTVDQRFWKTEGTTKHRRFANHMKKVMELNTEGKYANVRFARVLEVPEEDAWQFGYEK